MTRVGMIRLAREAGLVPVMFDTWKPGEFFDRLERFAEIVAAKEREACALHIQSCRPPVAYAGRRVEIGLSARMAYARAIRERGAA